ncbi:hyaluronate lyase N-terminal domain-containing protein [Prescottella equi]
MTLTRIQIRRGTEDEWYDENPTLAAGELGYERDTFKFKIGDGTRTWRFLPYAAAAMDHSHAPADIEGLVDAFEGLQQYIATVDDTVTSLAGVVYQRPAFFSGVGAPPTSLPGARVGDKWLDETTGVLHKITAVS